MPSTSRAYPLPFDKKAAAYQRMFNELPKRRIEVVAAVIFDERGRIFATQRGYGEWKDWWEFPGGKMEPGETPEEALKREIQEELSTEISVDKFLCTVEYDYPKFHLTMHCYWCSLISEALHLNEHEAAKWLSIEQLGSVDWLPADVLVVNAIKSE
jgi:8-oxo-dGTP diphosphatase